MSSIALTGVQNSFIRRRPLLTFFVLSYAFFWLFLALTLAAIGLAGLKPDDLPAWALPAIRIIGAWMPSVAAALVVGVLEGGVGVRNLFGKFLQFRLPARWYLAALIPFGLAFVGAGLYRLLGGAPSGGVSLTPAFWVALVVTQLLAGPTGEEPGWRGFALPRLLAAYPPLRAGLWLGLAWNFWHLPLWLLTGFSGLDLLVYCVFFSIGIISLSLYMTWLFRRTDGSLVPMTMCHFAANAGFALVSAAGLGLGPDLPLMVVTFTLFLALAVVVWWVTWLADRSCV